MKATQKEGERKKNPRVTATAVPFPPSSWAPPTDAPKIQKCMYSIYYTSPRVNLVHNI